MRFFNIAGPCIEAQHYTIDPATRLKGVEQLVDMGTYFVVHAARQSGKTTCMQDLTKRLNAAGKYYALYCSLETVAVVPELDKGMQALIWRLQEGFKDYGIPHAEEFAKDANLSNYAGVLGDSLKAFCRILDRPLVLLLDEADSLTETMLVSVLRQFREGYNNRGAVPFVHSVALIGMRNLRDFRGMVRPESQSTGIFSPFNIITRALTVKNFTEAEVCTLYQQHTNETGQTFNDDAIALVYQQTQGQPWLVNAVAREVVVEMLDWDYTQPVTAGMVATAIQTIILRRDTHIDNLLERLKEPRVCRVIEPMIMGYPVDVTTDDFAYTRDLGLIRVTPDKKIEPAKALYAEVMVRTLNAYMQSALQSESTFQMPRYLKNGRVDMDYLMRDFQQFWRENSDIWIEKFEYREAAPYLILMAFLQRVVNGGGQIIREMAAGVGRLDICVAYENHKYPIELKLWRSEKTLTDGLEQTARYMDVYGCTEGWLLLFDRRPDAKWDDKIYMRKETPNGKTITVVGL
jgi:hypothetical protein